MLDRNGVFQFDDLVVLRKSRGPAVLMEIGVIVNRRDEARISSRKVRSRYIDAVVRVLKRHIRLDNPGS